MISEFLAIFINISLFSLISGLNLQNQCWLDVCSTEEDSIKFSILGDWGGLEFWPYYTPQQTRVAAQMAKKHHNDGSHFALALGDNFYFKGVTGVEDVRFKITFEQTFGYAALPIAWYALAGNHDHYGNVAAQIQYTNHSSRWKFPDYFYSFTYQTTNNVTAEFLMLDTVVLCGNTKYDHLLEQFLVGEILNQEKELPGPANPQQAYEAWNWIENKLANSKADYLFVAGHFPIWSISDHGPTKCLVDRLHPMLHKYNVTAYFTGHDHNLQHLRLYSPEYDTVVHHIVSGLGSFSDSSEEHRSSVPAQSSIFFYPPSSWFGSVGLGDGGFAWAKLTKKWGKFQYLKGDGKPLHEFYAKPRRIMD